MILHIARHEFRSLFATPLAWLLLALGQFLLAWLLLSLIEHYQMQYQPVLVKLNASMGAMDLVVLPFLSDPRLLVLLLLAATLLAMRLIAEERRQQTLPLLLSAPITATQIVLGKYLGALIFGCVLVLLWGGMTFSLALGTDLDTGRLLASLLGLLLLVASLFAFALWVSALTANPAVAAAVTFSGGLGLLVLQQGAAPGVLGHLSLLTHYEPFLYGQLALVNIGFFAVVTVGFLLFAIQRLDTMRVLA